MTFKKKVLEVQMYYNRTGVQIPNGHCSRDSETEICIMLMTEILRHFMYQYVHLQMKRHSPVSRSAQ